MPQVTETSRLPRPVTENWDWQRHAARREMDSEHFFHPDAERGQARERRVASAKAVCDSCPVMAECRRYALAAEEQFGVWGGLDERERREMIARRRQVPAA